MGLFHNLVYQPRKLFLRKALFQIHLWAGIFLSLYVVVIAVTGAVLVFEDELTSATLPSNLSPFNEGKTASITLVMRSFGTGYQGAKVSMLTTPSAAIPAYQLRALDAQGHEFELAGDPATGVLYRRPYNWVNWVHDLHLYLLLGSAYGVQVNGAGAAILLLLAVSGLFLWWPGVRNWSRGFKISLRSNWRRINFDTHYAIGIWTLAIVSWWAISGIYFAWYRQVGFVVNTVSTLRGMVSPELPPRPVATSSRASLEAVLSAVQQASPHGRLFGISDPSLATDTVFAQMDLRAPGDFSHRDIVTVDTATAKVLTIWHYGQNVSAGDWIMWSMHPLHFGTLWGMPFKILWFLMGLSLAVLSVTGLIMYWNRYLRHRLK